MLTRIPPANFKAQQNLVSGQGESLNFSAPKIFRIYVKLRQNLRQENCREKICGFRKYPKFSPNFRNLAFQSSQIIISNIPIHKCLTSSPNLCQMLRQMDLWDHSAPNCCAKSIFAINLHQKCAPNFVRVAVLRRSNFGCADRILRPPGQGGVKFIVRISENCNLCHANLNTTIKGL